MVEHGLQITILKQHQNVCKTIRVGGVKGNKKKTENQYTHAISVKKMQADEQPKTMEKTIKGKHTEKRVTA